MSGSLPSVGLLGTASRRHVALIAFTVGVATLGAEIAAARLIAPWFGASTIVWANTIGTVLVALSVGYALGGRLADRDPTLAGLCRLILAGAALLMAVPFVSGPFLRLSVDALDRVEAGAAVGSLLAVLVLIAAPVLVLGCVAPWVLRLTISELDHAGRTSGRLSAITTVGSLVGTFSSALLLIPVVGTRRTFLLYAIALAVVVTPGLRSKWQGALLAIVGVVLMAVPTGTVKASGGTVLWEAETKYQYARVVEFPSGERWLELNEGQAIHSLLPADRRVLTGNYWDEPLVLPASVLGRAPRSMAILGGAAGTVARAYGRYFPDTRIDSVEIDGELPDLGRRFFDLRGPNLHSHVADARPWLRQTKRRFDVIYVDAYRQPYIAFYLATREFFALARERLTPGGVVIVNVSHPEKSSALERALTATMRVELPQVARDAAQPGNTQLVATAGVMPSGARLVRTTLPKDLRPLAAFTAAQLEPGLEGGPVWTDDRAPVEWLIDGSILKVAAEGER